MAKRHLAIVIAAVLGLSTHSPFVGEARADGPACAAGSTIALEGGSTVCGVAANRPGVFIYKGLAYATAGRWQAPVPAQWPPVGELMAVQFGPICPQDDPPQPSAEDCLYLNIWAPENAINGARSLPVMLFIHGGAFVKGRGS
jgi:carboxylesterase type B